MIKVKEGKYGRYIEAQLDISIEAYLPEGDLREEISEEEATKMIDTQQENLSDCTETMANASFKLIP